MNLSRQNWQSDLLTVWLIATTSLCAGLLFNQFRDKPLPLIYQSKGDRVLAAAEHFTSAPAAIQSAEVPEEIGLEDFRAMAESKEVIILDARPEIFHRLGHVPGALSLPREDFEAAFTVHKNRLEAGRNALIVIYCSGSSCEDSELVRKALHRLGFNRVAVFKGGWSAWTDAELPEERTP